jgi:tRNA(Ile)-lysidine synthase
MSSPASPPAPSVDAVDAVKRAVASLVEQPRPLVLAVSGGLDSTALLDACAAVLPARVAAVATFDHGTGPAATAAVAHVVRRARALGLRVEAGRAGEPGRTEAQWRAARWRFLRAVAARHRAVVVTAHTADDQAETVFMRVLRDAGARGLAGLYAPADVLRPFLALDRETLARYAAARGLVHVEDPSNRSRRHLRNRVRLDLLPACEAARPGFRDWLLDLSARAAAWRRELDAVVDRLEPAACDGALSVAASRLQGYDAEALSVLWPALAGRVGVALDWRGTRRLAEFTTSGTVGGSVQLSGGLEVVRRRDEFVLRRAARRTRDEGTRPLEGVVVFGRWCFRPIAAGVAGAWTAELPSGSTLTVRAWRPGDRMRLSEGRPPRRVKRLFAEAGVAGMDRAGWPVVLADGEIVWIPGVRRSDAASARSGRPLRYRCERCND